jgi:hypothetical protein
MNFPFDNFYASHSSRMPKSTNYPHYFHPYGPCSYCSNPYHSSGNCPTWDNFSLEQININFSSSGSELNSNFYTPDWSNHFDLSWQAHATGNYAPQFYGLHHLDICSLIIHLPIIHHTTILLNNLRLKTLSRNSCNLPANPFKKSQMPLWQTMKQLQGWKDNSVI